MTSMVGEACLSCSDSHPLVRDGPRLHDCTTYTIEPGLGVRSYIVSTACPCCCARHPSELKVPGFQCHADLHTRTSQMGLMPLHAQ